MTPRPALAGTLRDAARRWGTPLYLYDLPTLDADARVVRDAFPDPWLRLYALKANPLPGLVARIASMGFGASVVSGGELRLAARAGVPPGRTVLEGIGKTDRDLRLAVRAAAGGAPLLWVSLESADEARALARLATDARVSSLDVLVRLNPGARPETHLGLAVGAPGSKFGVAPEELSEVVDAGGGPGGPLRFRGLHVHVGSQLGAVDAWRAALRTALAQLRLHRSALPDLDTLDLGSGFPVTPAGELSPSPARFADEARRVLAEADPSVGPTRLAIEPGRAVVARSGWLVARVLHVRARTPQQVVLDAGMTELVRPALYGAEHPVVALTGLGRPLDDTALQRPLAAAGDTVPTVVDGPVCESTDRLGEYPLPPLRRDDLVAIGLAGAYGSSMASTYNGRLRPPAVAWDVDRLELLRPRGRVDAIT